MILRHKYLVILGLVPVAVLLGFAAGERVFGAGRDFLEYYFSYQEIRLADTLDVLRFEPGYVLASWMAKFTFGVEFATFFSVLATIALLIKFHLFSQYRHPILTVLFYLCCWYPLHEYTQIRAGVALALSLLAAEFFFRRSYALFAIAISFAVSFHAASLIIALAIPGAFILTKINLPLVLVVIAALAAVLASAYTIFVPLAVQINPLIEAYQANLEGNRVNLLSLQNLLAAALLASIWVTGSLESRREKTFFILAFAALVSAVALQGAPVLSHRIKEMFLFFLVPLAFNTRLTKRTLPQYASATTLAGWSLYSAIANGIVGLAP